MGALQALVGHQYGRAGLPSQVEVAEYQMLLQVCQQAGIMTSALEEAYLRDENSILPSYWLRAPACRSEGPMESNVSLTQWIDGMIEWAGFFSTYGY